LEEEICEEWLYQIDFFYLSSVLHRNEAFVRAKLAFYEEDPAQVQICRCSLFEWILNILE
jgi:hypothetical protein